MPNRPSYTVTEAISEITSGLTVGQAYIAQHVGGNIVLYADHPTQPTADTDIGWFQLKPDKIISFEGSTADPTWVRTLRGEARLTINES